MPRYLISFDDGSMDHIPEEDWPTVGEASHAVGREIKQAGAWIFGCGLLRQQASIVSTDGSVADGPLPGDQGRGRRLLDHRSRLTRGGARLGGQDRRVLPVCPRGTRDRVRPGVLRPRPVVDRAGAPDGLRVSPVRHLPWIVALAGVGRTRAPRKLLQMTRNVTRVRFPPPPYSIAGYWLCDGDYRVDDDRKVQRRGALSRRGSVHDDPHRPKGRP